MPDDQPQRSTEELLREEVARLTETNDRLANSLTAVVNELEVSKKHLNANQRLRIALELRRKYRAAFKATKTKGSANG